MLTILLMLLACGPACLRSHDVQVFVPGHMESRSQTTTAYSLTDGKTHLFVINTPVWVPDHYRTRQICDEYEPQ